MREYKPGAFGIILVHPYLTSQILDYQPADGQSQPCTLGIFIQFLETFKNPVALIGRNTATGIRHRHSRRRRTRRLPGRSLQVWHEQDLRPDCQLQPWHHLRGQDRELRRRQPKSSPRSAGTDGGRVEKSD